MAFNFFNKKKDGEGSTQGGGSTTEQSSGAKFESNPAKARVFFDRARAVHDSTNYEYAMTLWLQGLRQDPSNMPGLEGFMLSAVEFSAANPKAKGPTKEQVKNFEGKGPVEKYLVALLNWGPRVGDFQLGIKALEAAVKLDLSEAAYWIGTRVLRTALEDPKAKKEHFVTMMELFREVGAYDRAVQAGDAACKLDPTDQKLMAETRNMSAQATMSKGGYEQSGQQGGFRTNVRDMHAQRAREDEERLVKSEDTIERVVTRAREDYESRPNDPPTIQKYAKALLERGTPEDEQSAYKVLMKGFEVTKTYRFKQLAGDIRLRAQRRKLIELRDAAEGAEPESDVRRQYESALRQYRENEIREFEERVQMYPTDLNMKYELGRRYFEVANHEKAIEQFQMAQNAPGLANTVQNMLGQSFLSMGWVDEAEGTFRRALEAMPVQTDDLGMSLRYNLLIALERKARDGNDKNAAEEALKLASGIAIQQIGYKDIRERRESLQQLVKELRAK